MFYIIIYNFNNKYISFKDLSDKAWTENTSESIFVKKKESVAPLHVCTFDVSVKFLNSV